MTLKLEVGKKYVDRDGDVYRVLCIDLRGKQPILAALDAGDEEEVSIHSSDGRFYSDGAESDMDLVAEYVEPVKPKKLYAFRNLLHNRIDWYEDVSSKFPMVEERAPEYDREV
jgi:hypothetical protein